jgi:ATP/maltotriose-dependent transcriptional regulator MalT
MILLTRRESEVLSCIAAGLSNEEIADKLNVALSTVKVHTRNIFNKLKVNNRIKAVTEAQKLEVIIDPLFAEVEG